MPKVICADLTLCLLTTIFCVFISVPWREKHHLGQNLLDQLTKTCPGSSSRVTHPRSVSTILTHPVKLFRSVAMHPVHFRGFICLSVGQTFSVTSATYSDLAGCVKCVASKAGSSSVALSGQSHLARVSLVRKGQGQSGAPPPPHGLLQLLQLSITHGMGTGK